jgi:predicted permease
MWWKRKQQDFNAAIEAHLQLEAEQLQAEGLTPAEAQAAAHRAFGNRMSAEERFYESGRWMFWDHLLRDVRFATRVLKKDAAFSALAVLGLALGLGGSTAIFALINAVLQFSDDASVQDRASYVGLDSRALDTGRFGPLSYSDYRYYQDHATAFRTMNAQSSRFRFILGPFSSGNTRMDAEDVQGRFVSANFLFVNGLTPALGRSFSAEEEHVGGPPVALLHFGFWKAHFAADAAVVGKTVVLNGHALTVIGISDARYHVADPSDFYLPLVLQPVLLDRGDWLHESTERWLQVDALLRPGVTARWAQAEVDVLSSALSRTRPAHPADGGVLVSLGGGNPEKRKELAAMAFAVIITVSMILLIACSNLASLLLARAVVRRREIGVRLSLGASRARLICQLLTESMLLAVGGGALGVLLSHWLAKSLIVLMNPLPGFELRLDPRVVLYDIVLALATGVSFGLAPAIAATKTNLSQALHAEGLSGVQVSRSRRIWSPRNGLIIVPLAVSLMLLMGAGLTVRCLQRIYLSGPAFDCSHLIGMSFRLNMQGYDEARTRQFQGNLRERIATMPSVTSVALASAMPLSNGTGSFLLLTAGSAISQGRSSPHADFNVVSAGFFETVGVPVVRGRAFTTFDREGSPPVAMVSQALARRYWPKEEPVGQSIRLASADNIFFEVIGVAPDWQDATAPFNSVRPTVYVPYGQAKLFLKGARIGSPPYEMQFLIRTSGESARVKTALRQEALAIDSSLRVNIQTLEEMRESQIGPFKRIALLLSALGALALVMASVGIYAILAYAVSQRTREIGIRMALGAQSGEILALVMQRTATLIAWGIGLGIIAALALKQILSSTVANLGGLDAVTCISVALLLSFVAILAGYLPARKALRVDPVQALRCE